MLGCVLGYGDCMVEFFSGDREAGWGPAESQRNGALWAMRGAASDAWTCCGGCMRRAGAAAIR